MNRVVAQTVVLVSALVLTGCVTGRAGGTTGAQVAGQACSWLRDAAPGAPERPRDDRVVLIDRSASFRASSEASERGAALVDQAAAAAVAAYGEPDVRSFSLGLFDAGAKIHWLASQVELPGATGNDDTGVTTQRDEAQACVGDLLRENLFRPTTVSGTDVARAVSRGAGQLVRDAGQRRIVVFGDGLSNAGCADLGRPELREPEPLPTSQIYTNCGEHEPLDLNGVTVEFVAIGEPLGQEIEPAQQEWLDAFWTGFVTSAGGTFETGNGSGEPLPPDDPDGSSADDPVVTLPSVPGDGVRTVDEDVPLESDVLFATAEHTFRPGGEAEVLRRLERYRTKKQLHVRVTGYTDERGSSHDNDLLSGRRAMTVRKFLEKNGFEEVESSGAGESSPLCRESAPECWKRNRRVEIHLSYVEYAAE
ncbi:OmpA family protein [Kineosporia sp. J2-2]|uniref:OmpA family protein n=1 Tax=Kineosporia corallincola TaxID=2835133 RepID=A0ABS5TK71_9ACTN|nr:OmpA family protein [Kineosporia corallincola]MBT0771496.1 OmpA family protein [Kineosporia corallincola]